MESCERGDRRRYSELPTRADGGRIGVERRTQQPFGCGSCFLGFLEILAAHLYVLCPPPLRVCLAGELVAAAWRIRLLPLVAAAIAAAVAALQSCGRRVAASCFRAQLACYAAALLKMALIFVAA